jgi:hypothetical protein
MKKSKILNSIAILSLSIIAIFVMANSKAISSKIEGKISYTNTKQDRQIVINNNDNNNKDECFKLSTPLIFGNAKTGDIEITEICKSKLDYLMNLPIYGSNDQGDGIIIGEKKYKNCNDGFEYDLYSLYERAIGSFYYSKCPLLEKINLGEIKHPKITYLNKFNFLKLSQIPLKIIIPYTFVSESEHENFEKSREYKLSLQDVVKRISIKKQTPVHLEFQFNFPSDVEYLPDLEYSYDLREVMRADFDNDGIEDILINIAVYLQGYNYRVYDNFIITKTSKSSKIKKISKLLN